MADYEAVSEEREGASFCMGYVRPVSGTVRIMSCWASGTPEVLYPFPGDVYSKQNPGSLDLYAPAPIMHALFPGRQMEV
jgi:hypothetical protein